MNDNATDTTVAPSSSVMGRNLLQVLGEFPVIGPYAKAFDRANPSVRKIFIFAIIVLIIYPVLSFVIVLGVISLTPSKVQSVVRGYVLNSLGVNGATDDAIDQSNKAIDGEIPLNFTDLGRETYYESVTPSQKMNFNGILRIKATSPQPAGCAGLTPDQNLTLGTINVLPEGSTDQLHFPIHAVVDQTQSIGSITEGDWKKIMTQNTDGERNLYSLQFGFSKSWSQDATEFFKCYSIQLGVSMTIYKPLLDEAVGGS